MSDSKPQVLVLDEDALALELYARELRHDDQVVTSGSIQETHQYLTDTIFDVLILETAVNQDEGWILQGNSRFQESSANHFVQCRG